MPLRTCRGLSLWLPLVLLSLTSCGLNIPSALVPPPLPVQRTDDQVKTTFFPLPVVATDPNTGNDYGCLPVLTFPREDQAMGMILAPSVIYNELNGITGAFRLLAYPDSRTHYRLIADKSTGINSYFEFWYDKKALQAAEWSYGLQSFHDTDSYMRFYGFGNDSREDDETSYTARTLRFRGYLGYRFTEALELCWQERLSTTSLSDHHLPSLPPTEALFPEVMKNRRVTTFAHRLSLSFDTRDWEETPTCGVLAQIYGETAARALGSDSSFDRLGVIFKGFHPLDADHRFITAVRVRSELLLRQELTPFYEWPYLGGFFSNRGFGDWRYIDRNMIAFTVEQRIEVFRLNHFGVISHWEVAPFLDVGKVFPTVGKFNLRNLKTAGGVAFRASVRPQVVGHVEFGFSREGSAIFMGLGYPF